MKNTMTIYSKREDSHMKLQIIIGSTRPGRVTNSVAHWVEKEAQNLPDTQVEVVDLLDYELPFLDEAISPQYNPNRTPNPVAKKWLSKLTEADAYVIVTPEYNRSFPGVLKNALDYIAFEFAKKPVGLVAHGSTGGAQALGNLRSVVPALQAISIPTATYLSGRPSDMIGADGVLVDEALRSNPYGPQAALKGELEQLKWYSDALAAARA
jgi:NAD(P)H-dependent FMN reductase